MLRFLALFRIAVLGAVTGAALLLPAGARAFDLGVYDCRVETGTVTQVFPDGTVQTLQQMPGVTAFRIRLSPFEPGRICAHSWRAKTAPYECSASYQAAFTPELFPGTPVLFSPLAEKPDIYYAPNGYMHFANDVLFHISWSEFDRAWLLRGQCAQTSVTND